MKQFPDPSNKTDEKNVGVKTDDMRKRKYNTCSNLV